MFGSVCGVIWGPEMGGKVVGLICGLFGISSVLTGLLQNTLISNIGYFNMWLLLTALTVVSLFIIVFFFKQKYYEDQFEQLDLSEEKEKDELKENEF